jgi:TBC1 domain family member 15
LIRAESLFRRFQRLVEAIDKKHNFPTRRTQQSSLIASSAPSSEPNTPAATTTGGNGPRDTGKAKEEQPKKIISPELRKILSREVEVLPRKVVQKMGDGFSRS